MEDESQTARGPSARDRDGGRAEAYSYRHRRGGNGYSVAARAHRPDL